MAKLLIIEPDAVLAKTYAKALQGDGHRVETAPTAQAGVLAADRLQPDLVILELQLVEHSGIEFLYEFRSYADWQDTPVIIHTQVPQNEFAGSLDVLKQELGVAAYLYKPHAALQDLANAVEAELATIKQ